MQMKNKNKIVHLTMRNIKVDKNVSENGLY